MEGRSETIADQLLDIEAVAVRTDHPFVWASGLRSPVYCDTRLALGVPHVRETVVDGFLEVIDALEGPIDGIVGVATGGIAHAALIASRRGLPAGYVRASAKKHGKTRRVEGGLRIRSKIVVVEDLVSTGGSSVAAVEALHEDGYDVIAVVAIFSYGFPSAEARFRSAGIPLICLCDLDTLARVIESRGLLTRDQKATLQEWRHDPDGWSDRFTHDDGIAREQR